MPPVGKKKKRLNRPRWTTKKRVKVDKCTQVKISPELILEALEVRLHRLPRGIVHHCCWKNEEDQPEDQVVTSKHIVSAFVSNCEVKWEEERGIREKAYSEVVEAVIVESLVYVKEEEAKEEMLIKQIKKSVKKEAQIQRKCEDDDDDVVCLSGPLNKPTLRIKEKPVEKVRPMQISNPPRDNLDKLLKTNGESIVTNDEIVFFPEDGISLGLDPFNLGPILEGDSVYTDMQFLVGGTLFKAHKIIFTRQSPFFCSYLQGKVDGIPIELEDISEETFKILLRFLYRGNLGPCVPITPQYLVQFLAIADRFTVPRLIQFIHASCSQQTDPEFALELVQTAAKDGPQSESFIDSVLHIIKPLYKDMKVLGKWTEIIQNPTYFNILKRLVLILD